MKCFQDLLQQKGIAPLFFYTESEETYNLIGEQEIQIKKGDTKFYILNWLKNKKTKTTLQNH